MKFVKLFLILLPWLIRRPLLNFIFNYKIDAKAYIGRSWIFPKFLEIGPNAKIGHFNVGIHLDSIILKDSASIGRGNWITGFPSNSNSKHFIHQHNRLTRLIVGSHSAITKNHHFDCTNQIEIGNFVTIAGYHSQFLTHSIDLMESRQDSNPIIVGDYSFVGTNSVILGGSVLPAYSVLGAKSLLNKSFQEPYILYAGNPAKPVKKMNRDAKYFNRKIGFVY